MSADINISNYESYLYSYVDGELNADETAALERFLEANPSLRAELDLLLATRLQPEHIVFDNKAALYRGSEINLQNYETYLLSYIDNELNTEEAKALESFMVQHPKVRQELIMWQGTRLHADPAIRFENKAVLYRHTKERKVRPIYWWAASAAAVVAGLLVFFQLNRPVTGTDQPVVAVTQPQQQQQPDAVTPPQETPPAVQEQTTSGERQATTQLAANTPAPQRTSAQNSNNTSNIKVTAAQQNVAVKQEGQDIASIQPTQKVTDQQQPEATLNTAERVVEAPQVASSNTARPSLDPQTPPAALATAAPAAEPGELIMSVTGNGLESKMLDKVSNVARFFSKRKKNN